MSDADKPDADKLLKLTVVRTGSALIIGNPDQFAYLGPPRDATLPDGSGPLVVTIAGPPNAPATLGLKDGSALARGTELTDELRQHLATAEQAGDVRPLVRFLKLHDAFRLHRDVQRRCAGLAQKHASVRAVIELDARPGRPVAGAREYDEVLRVLRAHAHDDPPLTFEAAITEAYAVRFPTRRYEDKGGQAFRRRVFDQKERSQPCALPVHLNLDDEGR